MSIFETPTRTITFQPDTVDDGIGPMPLPLQREFVTLPEWELCRACADSISRLNALTVGDLEDFLRLSAERWPTYHEAMRRGHQIYQDMGRFEAFPDRAVRDRKAEAILQAIRGLDRDVHRIVGRAHGLQQQSVQFVRKTGYDGYLFQLTSLPSLGRSS